MILENFDLEQLFIDIPRTFLEETFSLINIILWQSPNLPFWVRLLWTLFVFGLVSFLIYILIRKGRDEVDKKLVDLGISHERATREELFGTYPEYATKLKITVKEIIRGARNWFKRMFRIVVKIIKSYLFPQAEVVVLRTFLKVRSVIVSLEEQEVEEEKEKIKKKEEKIEIDSELYVEGKEVLREFFGALTSAVVMLEEGFSAYKRYLLEGPPEVEAELEKERKVAKVRRPPEESLSLRDYLKVFSRRELLRRWWKYLKVFLKTRLVLIWASFRRYLRYDLQQWGAFKFFSRLKFRFLSPARFVRNIGRIGSKTKNVSEVWLRKGFRSFVGYLRIRIIRLIKSGLMRVSGGFIEGVDILSRLARLSGTFIYSTFQRTSIYFSAVTLVTLVSFVVLSGAVMLLIMSMLAVVEEGLGVGSQAVGWGFQSARMQSAFLEIDADLEVEDGDVSGAVREGGEESIPGTVLGDAQDSASGGDIIKSQITVTASKVNIHGLKIDNTIKFQELTADREKITLLDSSFPDDLGLGYQVVADFPEPSSVRPSSVGGRSTKLSWDAPFLAAQDSVTLQYRLRVDDNYNSEKDGPICLSVQAEALEDAVGPAHVCINSEGMSSLAVWAEKLLECLVKNDGGVYNHHDPKCRHFSDCAQALEQFAASQSVLGHVTCVNFVVGVMRCAGIYPPYAGDASSWYKNYQNSDRFLVFSNGSEIPQRGDIIVFSGGSGGFGHIGVVLYSDNFEVRYAHSNMGTLVGELAISNGRVEAPPGFEVLGFIRAL